MSFENDSDVNENSIADIVQRYQSDVASLVPYLPWLEAHADYAMQVIFCCFDARTERVYQARL